MGIFSKEMKARKARITVREAERRKGEYPDNHWRRGWLKPEEYKRHLRRKELVTKAPFEQGTSGWWLQIFLDVDQELDLAFWSSANCVLRVVSSLKDVATGGWVLPGHLCGRIHKVVFLIKDKFLLKSYGLLLFIPHARTVILQQEIFRFW